MSRRILRDLSIIMSGRKHVPFVYKDGGDRNFSNCWCESSLPKCQLHVVVILGLHTIASL